jgi:glycosyltransferase involved in cell wall biosynthesis
MKILMSAYACEPNRGSEPGVGWNLAVQMARYHEVWVLTRANNRTVIEAELARKPIENLHFDYFDLPGWIMKLKKYPGGLFLYYYFWQVFSYFKARGMHRKVGFDLAHHVTFVMWRAPSFLWKLGVPFIWGPIGGGSTWPKSLRPVVAEPAAYVFEYVRDFLQMVQILDPFVLQTARNSAVILAGNSDTARLVRRIVKPSKPLSMFSPSKISTSHVTVKPPGRTDAGSVRLIFVGGLIPRKAPILAVSALAEVLSDGYDCTLEFVGDGPERKRLEGAVRNLNLADKVIFHGTIPFSNTLEKMLESDIMLFPTMRETSPLAAIEGLANGLPIVCCDVSGINEVVTDECGIIIKTGSPGQVARDLAAAIERLAGDPKLRERMGEAGRRRVAEHYTWEKAGQRLADIYESVLTGIRVKI